MLQLSAGLLVRRDLGCSRLHVALQFSLARAQAARLELRLLRLSLQAALLLAGVGQTALGGDDGVVQLGVTLLGRAQVNVQRIKARFVAGPSFVQRFELRLQLGQLARQLVAPGGRRVGLLAQAQQFHIQAVGTVLRLGGFTPRGLQAQGGFGVGRLQAHGLGLGVV